MLSKLIKYEFKASGRILLPIYIATLVLSLLSGIFFKVPSNIKGSIGFLNFISILLLVLYGIFVFAEIIISVFISIYRFKINLFDSEGYLMNTLPVKTHSHISSKLIVSMVYEIVAVIVALISAALFLAFTQFYANLDISVIMDAISELFKNYLGTTVTFIAEGVLLVLTALACKNMMFYASVSVGHSANTKRVSKSVLAYLGFYLASQLISFVLIEIFAHINVFDNFTPLQMVHITIFGVILLECLYTSAYYAITNYFMKKRLNLQ